MIFRSLLIATLALSLGAAAAASVDDTVVAQRGNVTLTVGQLRAALATQTQATRAALAANSDNLEKFVQSVLIGRVLLAQAETAKWDQNPAVAAALIRAHDTLIVDTYLSEQAKPAAGYPSEDDIKAAYQQNLAKLQQPKRYHLQQILIALPAGASPAADAAARKTADDVRAQAIKPGADFQSLAAARSTDSAVAGAKGDMGVLAEDQLLPSVRTAVAGLAVDGVSKPVRTDGGWHVIKLVAILPAGAASLAQVHDQLAQALRQQKAQQNAQSYVNQLIKAQPIQLNAIAIGTALGTGQ